MILLVVLLLSAITSGQSLALNGVTLKIAVDARGGVADRAAKVSDRFTCSESLDAVHRLRRDSDAILIGRQTVEADNPSLLVRRGIPVECQPLRVVLDTSLSLLSSNKDLSGRRPYQIFTDGHPTLVYHQPNTVTREGASINGKCVNVVSVETDESGRLSVSAICRHLKQEYGIQHLMVEGGPAVAQSFLQNNLVDRCVLVRATSVTFRKPILSGINEHVLMSAGLKLLGTYTSGVDEVECWSREGWPTEELSEWP